MKLSLLGLASAALLATSVGTASAQYQVYPSYPAPVQVAPAPVYVPQPVYVQPAPVVVAAPAPVVGVSVGLPGIAIGIGRPWGWYGGYRPIYRGGYYRR